MAVLFQSLREHGLLDENDDSQHTGVFGRLCICVYGRHFTLRSECVYIVLILP